MSTRVRALRPLPESTNRVSRGEMPDRGVMMGLVAGPGKDGTLRVNVPGRDTEFIARRCLQQWVPECHPNSLAPGTRVLILCENGAPDEAIVLGIAANIGQPPAVALPATSSAQPRAARLDGQRVVLEAEHEIVLRCGKGSLTLTADGRIVMKGVEITSRALRQHKIKGGTVNIN